MMQWKSLSHEVKAWQINADEDLSPLLDEFAIQQGPVAIKVNWTSPLPGMYTSSDTLRRLLPLLPRPVWVLEGHSVGRLQGVKIRDLPQDSEAYRQIIRDNDERFLQDMGMSDIFNDDPDIRYFNVTEALWQGKNAPASEVEILLQNQPQFPELSGYIPCDLLSERNQLTLINLTRVKVSDRDEGDWSLALKNMFGLIPDPYRIHYHNTDLPGAILAVNSVYRQLFRVVDLIEGFESVVQYGAEGAYSVPWGRYDILAGGLAFTGTNPVTLDLETGKYFGRDYQGRELIRRGAAELRALTFFQPS